MMGSVGRRVRRKRHETGFSAPGQHEVILQCSEEFWEERSAELFEAAEAEIEKERQARARELTGRWGAPETLDLEPYFQAAVACLPLHEPLAYLSTYAADALLWRRPKEDRSMARPVHSEGRYRAAVCVGAMVGDLGILIEPPVAWRSTTSGQPPKPSAD